MTTECSTWPWTWHLTLSRKQQPWTAAVLGSVKNSGCGLCVRLSPGVLANPPGSTTTFFLSMKVPCFLSKYEIEWVFMCMYHESAGDCGGHKRSLDPVEVGLWTFMSFSVGAKNKQLVLYKSSKHTLPLSLLNTPSLVHTKLTRLFFCLCSQQPSGSEQSIRWYTLSPFSHLISKHGGWRDGWAGKALVMFTRSWLLILRTHMKLDTTVCVWKPDTPTGDGR